MPISRLTQYLPPKLVYVREPLAEEENALGPFKEMLEHAAIPDGSDEGFYHLVYGEADGEGELKFPEGAEGERIRGILAENAKAFELMDQGLDRGRLQLPEPVWGADNADSVRDSECLEIAQVRTVRGDALLADADFADAAADYRAVHRLGRLVVNGEGMWVHTLGTGIRRMGLGGIRLLAPRPDVPCGVLRDLSEYLRCEPVDEGGIQKNLAIELGYWTLNRLDEVPDGGTLESTVDALLRECYSDKPRSWTIDELVGTVPQRSPEELADLERWLGWRREKLLFLLEGHPKPFDKIATVRLMGEYQKRVLNNVEKAFAGDYEELRRQDVEEYREMQAWPAHLTPGWPCRIAGETSSVAWDDLDIHESTAALCDLDLNSDAPLPPAPTDEELEAAREKLRHVDNPIGKLVALPMLDSSPAYLIALYLHERCQTEKLLAKWLG